MAEMSDDDVFVTSEVYGEDLISTGTGKSCWYYTKKFLLAIVVIALIALLVIQLITIGSITNFEKRGGYIYSTQGDIDEVFK